MNESRSDGDPRRYAGAVALSAALVMAASAVQAQDGTALTPPAARDSRSEVRFDSLRPDNYFRDWARAYQSPEAFSHSGSFYTQSVGFDRGDGQQETIAGFYRNLSDSLSSLVETSYLPNPQGLSEWSVLGQMGAMFGDGWGMQAGLRHSELGLQGQGGRRADAQLGLVTLEKVWNSYRSQYTIYTSRRENGLSSSGHRMSLDYLYGSGSSVGLTYGRDRATDNLTVAHASVAGASSNVGVSGEHLLAKGWAVNYDALFLQADEQRGLTPEIRIGLRLAF